MNKITLDNGNLCSMPCQTFMFLGEQVILGQLPTQPSTYCHVECVQLAQPVVVFSSKKPMMVIHHQEDCPFSQGTLWDTEQHRNAFSSMKAGS